MKTLLAKESNPCKKGRARTLDRLDLSRFARSVIGYNPSLSTIRRLLDVASEQIPGMATFETVRKIYCANPDTITVFSRVGTGDHLEPPEGFIAMLPLTEDGRNALFDGRLDTAAPDVGFIARQHEIPAAIYVWCIFISPRISGGIAHMMERVSSRKYRHAPLYCKAANGKALRFFKTLGFVMGAEFNGHYVADLMYCPREPESAGHAEAGTPNARAASCAASPERTIKARRLDAAGQEIATGEIAPEKIATPRKIATRSSAPRKTSEIETREIYDSYQPGTSKNRIGITVVHSLDDMLKVFNIRAATYLAEQELPFQEDVDGNDFTATHLIGFVGDEPAGCLRIRYFADFVKLERLAVLRRFRHTRLAFRLIEAGISFCRKKGYHRFYGQAEAEAIPLWRRYGFKPRNGEGITYLTDRKYVEGDLEIEAAEDRLTNFSGAYTLIRPEGQWDRPSQFESRQKA